MIKNISCALCFFLYALALNSAVAEDITLQGEEIVQDMKNNTITLKDNVRAKKGKNTLRANAIIFDREKKIFKAVGKVKYTFDQSIFVNSQLLVLDKDNNVYAEKVQYSTCKISEDKTQAWIVKATSVRRDKNKKTVTLRNALFKISGIPVYYWPKVVLPDITAKKMNGWLVPTWGTRSQLGVFFSNTYYRSIGDTKDLLITPTYTTRAGYTVTAKYFDVKNKGKFFTVDASLTKTKDASTPYMGHIFINYQALGKNRWKTALSINTALNKNYFKKYSYLGNQRKSYLKSTLYREKTYRNAFFKAELSKYYDLRIDRTENTAIIAPKITLETQSTPDKNKGIFTASTYVRSYKNSSSENHKLSSTVGYRRPKYLSNGMLFVSSIFLRSDMNKYAYSVPKRIGGKTYDSDFVWRVIPSAKFSASMPLILTRDGKTYVVEPLVGAFFHRETGNFDYLPNYDSYGYEQDESNLFAYNRYGGLDRIDTDNRMAYGVRFKTWPTVNTYIQGFLGQSVTYKEKKIYSDYIGNISINMDTYTLSANFELDSKDLSVRKLEGNSKINYKDLSIQGAYTKINPGDAVKTDPLSQLKIDVAYRLNNRWKLQGQNVNSFKPTVATLRQSFGLTYTTPCNCMKTQVTYTKDFSVNPKEPTRTLYVKFIFGSFGNNRNYTSFGL